MTAPKELEQYLGERYGSSSALIVRDPALIGVCIWCFPLRDDGFLRVRGRAGMWFSKQQYPCQPVCLAPKRCRKAISLPSQQYLYIPLSGDPASHTGLREWSTSDTDALCHWIDGHSSSPQTPTRICHNLEQTAAILGVGTHTVQAWLRRDQNPLPHIRDGRRLLVPHFLLIRWVKEEAGRTLERKTNREE